MSASAAAAPRLCRRSSPVVHLVGVEATVAGDAPPIHGPLGRGRQVVDRRELLSRLGQNQKLVEVDVRVPLALYFELLVSEKDAAAVCMLGREFIIVEVLQHLVAEQQHLATRVMHL